jgi:hypothetical protein
MTASYCIYCARRLSGDHDGWAHRACERVVQADYAATEITDSRALEVVEDDLRCRRRCPHQVRAGGVDGIAIYCGQPMSAGDAFCPEHQCEADGDEDGAADERAARTLRLLKMAGPGEAV